ncbi:hypothetical protein Dfri01_58880 [Dyadobacter frigoris]|uniref:hypothetical protein n=1 Tax=Dyadobacter frigoris TaxID=2576211 RepID=UPI0024A1B3A8|nr:hypothetical protein [Dyadobacter frigoris]GLU56427.1 hypothetical protein Dfri01_58880 [Dyadobacter frigoris]
MNELSLINEKPYLSRIDRSVADNLDAIKQSYGKDAEIVRDFIIFISRSLKCDLFGFTTFTMADFSKVTGRDRRELSSKHSYQLAPGAKVVEQNGFQFISVFDYVLHQMQRTNIIFSKTYSYTEQGKTIDMVGIQIIKQLKITVDKNNDNKKVYQIRLGDEFMNGFINRYYTFEVTGYPKVGKGKGGDGRKSLYLFLYKAMHMNLSQNIKKSWFSVDLLCGICDVNFSEPAERKRLITKYLDIIINKGGVNISYEFVQKQNSESKFVRGYWVKVNFLPDGVTQIRETQSDHHFYSKLLAELKSHFFGLYGNKVIDFKEEESAPFQRWITNPIADRDSKILVFMNCYYLAYKKNLSQREAEAKMYNYEI